MWACLSAAAAWALLAGRRTWCDLRLILEEQAVAAPDHEPLPLPPLLISRWQLSPRMWSTCEAAEPAARERAESNERQKRPAASVSAAVPVVEEEPAAAEEADAAALELAVAAAAAAAGPAEERAAAAVETAAEGRVAAHADSERQLLLLARESSPLLLHPFFHGETEPSNCRRLAAAGGCESGRERRRLAGCRCDSPRSLVRDAAALRAPPIRPPSLCLRWCRLASCVWWWE